MILGHKTNRASDNRDNEEIPGCDDKYIGWLVFYSTLTYVDHLMPNSVYIYIYIYIYTYDLNE